MAITIQEYRSRIGRYLPKLKYRNTSLNNCDINLETRISNTSGRFCLIVIFSLVLSSSLSTNLELQQQNNPQNINFITSLKSSKSSNPVMMKQSSAYIELSNFHARYTNGNRQARGIKIAHLNKGPGHLATKINDIENVISGLHPHILGVSEANLFHHQDLQKVQIADYNLLTYPTLSNPDLNYSRIVTYVHKSIVCKTRPDLMSNNYTSIWIQVGLPRQKQILVCQTYREWQLLHQPDHTSKNIPAQLQRWIMFLDQWEKALNTGLEVVVSGDMNINHLDWAVPSNRQSSQTKKLKTLIEQLFQRILPHSVSQCVTVATRYMQGQAGTGIDHFYTNRPDKLSSVQAQVWGGSDHRIIFATRYSRVVCRNVRYVKKRAYKKFDYDAFLAEIDQIQWWDIYQCENF